MRAVVDTNVLAYFLLGTEPFVDEARRFWNAVREPIAPALWEAELANSPCLKTFPTENVSVLESSMAMERGSSASARSRCGTGRSWRKRRDILFTGG